MAAEIGRSLLWLALPLSLYAAFASVWGIRARDARWAASAQRATNALAVLLGVGLLLLLVAFLSDDFSVRYVAQHSSTVIPLYLKISAIWAGQEGSLLLWCALQAFFAAVATGLPNEKARPLVPWATVFLNLISAFFLTVTVLHSNPFATLDVVLAEGQGLNPLLRHPGMIFHPPALYIGYVGLAVPFAFALAALVTRRIEGWTRALHTWMLVAWLGLGIGLLLGMRWAYDVLGWGGYWGWDPVENAGLLPWFTLTALLHGAVMQEERRGFHLWNMLLAIFSFVLVLFGTFATRSGMIASVHAYAQSNLGGYFLSAIGVVLVGSFALLISRRKALPSEAGPASLFSRDGMFYLTLILFSTLTVSVFIGSVLPTITEVLTSRRFEAGPAWFDRVTGPQFGLLVLILGVCPLLGRAAATLVRLRRRLWLLALGAVGAPLAAAAFGFREPVSLLGLGVVGLAGVVTVAELVEGAITRSRRTGEAPINALWRLLRLQRRTYGGYLVHAGVVLMAVGILGTRLYPFEVERTFRMLEPVDVGRYTLVYEGLRQEFVDDHVRTYATVSVYGERGYLVGLEPRLDRYTSGSQTLTTPALRPSVREDLYLILSGWSDNGEIATFKVVINALVNFLWVGGLVFLAGGALALWPHVRSRTWNLVALVVALSLLGGAVWAMWGATHGMILGGTGRPLVGEPAPDIRLTLLDGSTVSLASLKGQVVLINFWASWCPSCVEEMPALQAVWEAYEERGVTFLGVAHRDTQDAVEAALRQYGTTYPVGLDAGERVSTLYGITGIPETFIIDARGDLTLAHIGPITAEALSTVIDAALDMSDQ